MKKKVVWLVVSCWMVAALLLASCAPAVVKEEEEKVAPPVKEEEVVVPKEVMVPEKEANMVKWTGKKLDGTVVEKMIEKPRYGGEYIWSNDIQPYTFDGALAVNTVLWNIDPVMEKLVQKDWSRGPGGTGEWQGQQGIFCPFGMEKGVLAESWELPDPGTLVFHIRQGIHWQDKPPVNGRELTADDVVFSLRRGFDPKNYQGTRSPYLIDKVNPKNSIYVSPTDKWAVIIKAQPEWMGSVYESASDVAHCQVAPEVIEKYGNSLDWKNLVGTGPFILKDYVGASSLTYVRNPNYWMHDPFFPENQLPYIDTLKALIIPDISTRLAALRTGKIDSLQALEAEDAEPLLKSNPELERIMFLDNGGLTLYMHTQKPELPFYDIKVRRALTMAINYQELIDDYYEGKAEIMLYPVYPMPEFADMYVPIEEMPESVQELYGYHPDKAKQLLAEAGYPNGFATEVLTANAPASYVDLLSIIKEYWTKIGVDMKIDVRDPVVVNTIGSRKTFSAMIASGLSYLNPFGMIYIRYGPTHNKSSINDPKVEATFAAVTAAYFDEPLKHKMIKELTPYINEQAWVIITPTAYVYNLWWPWLKGFYGVNDVSYSCSFGHPRYIWIDQELKKAMGR